jgi:predicted GNAT family N-acyltransferase
MTLRLIKDYKNISEYRLSLNKLAGNVFGIEFEKWYQLGFWKDCYVCFSFVDGERVVSNVAVSQLELLWKGERFRAVQIGGVMTDPDYRKRGLAARLMNTVLDEYEAGCDVVYLFANATVLDFYPKFGFASVRESRFTGEITEKSGDYGPVRKLDLANGTDLDLLRRLIRERQPFSGVLDVDRVAGILAWHCLYGFADHLYYLADPDLVALCRVEADTLHLYDVIGKEKPELLQPILKSLAPNGIRNAVFHFTPDFKDIQPQCRPAEAEGDTFFIKSATLSLNGEFLYPFTAHA